jgi:hypothetical protein
MNRLARRVRAAVTVAALTIGAMSAAAPFAAASSQPVPFKDPNIDGWLTFCNRSGQPITSGNLYTAPFAWKAIASTPAPSGYRGSTARATLDAFQPIQYVDPADWSGSELTGSSSFTDPNHPVAQATNADLPLLGFVQAYPPRWDSLEEIRMLWSGINKAQLQTPYAAAIVRITGNTWTLVEGGGGSCSQGQGASDETKILPKAALASPETVIPAGQPTTGTGGSSAASGAGSAAGGAQSPAASGAGSAQLAAQRSATGLGTGAKAGIALAVVAFGGIVIGVIAWRRRRST